MKPLSSLPNGIKAHDAEILTLSYSPPIHEHSEQVDQTTSQESYFLASGGRDRLIHIFDATPTLPIDQRYHLVTTLDSHSSSITITHFTSDGSKFVSCSGDKTMVLNTITGHEFIRLKSIPTPHGTINGFALDTATTKFAVSTGQDKRINVWNIQTGKLVRSYKPEGLTSEFYKCCVDPSGMFVATCSFDKQIRIYDFFSGELIHQVCWRSNSVI
jgi:mitogen-activated protein kinase binding protein 1